MSNLLNGVFRCLIANEVLKVHDYTHVLIRRDVNDFFHDLLIICTVGVIL